MLSLSLAWHVVWFARVTLSFVLFLVILRRQLYKQFPWFAVYTGWISLAGITVVGLNYASFVNGYYYFIVVAICNAVEAIMAFAIIYQMFAQRVDRYPVVSGMGKSAFRVTTLILVALAVALAWFVPGRGPSQWTSAYAVIQRTIRTLQCGQLVFLFFFCGYFRLSWRSRAFGIALGLGIVSSSSLAMNAIHSQIASGKWNPSEYLLGLVIDSACIVAVLVWLSYLRAPEQAPQPIHSEIPGHDLETWNQELERLLKL